MATSRYVQITDWALLEYEYTNEPISITQTKAFKIENSYDDSYQFLNGDISKKLTGNVQDNSSAVQSTIGNKWAYLDIDTIVPTIGTDANLNLIEETATFTSPNIEYDRVRVHIVSGFNLEGLDGLIAQISAKTNGGQRVDLANHTFLASDNEYNFNTKPLFLGDRLYDKYIEFKVPALSWIQTEFYANPANTGSFGYIYTNDNTGFVNEAFIDFTLHEINSTLVDNGNQFFITGNKYELSFLSADQFGLMGATIRESSEGDFFEFYMTWDNAFPDDYILNLNSVGGDWVIVHQIEVFEQIGANTFKTTNMTMLQENNFERPNIFRPIILNSDTASSFSIDYIMRFLNRADGNQIIREASYTSFEPKKYGKELEKITVSEGYRPMKVYNKIVSSDEQASTTSFQQNSPATFKTIVTTKYVPNFFNNTNISISTVGKDSQELDKSIFGQGKAIILLNEYDNRIRFKLFDKSQADGELEQLNLTTEPSIFLSFVYDDGTKLYVEQSLDNDVDPTSGEVEFMVNSEDATEILDQNNKRFYIVSRGGSDDTETVLYQGEYDNFANRDRVVDKLDRERTSELSKKIAELEEAQAKLSAQEQTVTEKLQENLELEAQLQAERREIEDRVTNQTQILRDEEERLRVALTKANELVSAQRQQLLDLLAQGGINNLKPSKFRYRELPGRSVDLSSGLKRIKPKVLKPSKPKTTVEKRRSDQKWY